MKKFFIYWRNDMERKDGMRYANVHLLVGYSDGTIASYQEMAEQLRKTFPEAEDKEIHCCSVASSHHFLGFSLITWSTYLHEGEYKGWFQTDKPPEYNWR